MTGKLCDQGLDTLERRFQALRDQLGALPEAPRPELETALQELSQAIAAMGADREAGESPPAASPGPCETILHHIFSAIPDLLTVHDRDFNTIMSNWHGYESVPEAERQGQPKCYRVYHHRDRPCEDCHALEVLATGQPLEVEKVNPVDGGVREVSAYPIRDESGQVVLVVEHVRDITERHLAAEALRESEELFRSLVENITLGITLISSDYRITMTNPAQGNLFHKHPREFIGKECFREFEKRQAVCPHCPGAIAMATGQKAEIDTKGVRDDGSSLAARIHAFPSFGPDGEITGFIEVVEDITQSKQVKEALQESEERFRVLFDYAPDTYFLMDLQGNFLDVNRGTEELTGYGREELIGRNYQALPLFDERQNSMVAALFQQAVNGKILGPVELNLNRKDGGNVIIEAKGLPLHRKGESLLLGIARDITARKQAEDALRESETRFRHISSTISDISYSCTAGPDGSYAIDWLAGAAERITGYSVEEIKARRCWEFLMIEADQPLFEKHIIGLAVGASGNCELRLRHKNGGIVWVASFAKIVQEPDQPELLHIYGGLVDITARKQAEEALAAHLQFLQLLQDTIPNPIFFKDAQGAYLGCNKAFEDYLGVTRQEIVGKSVYDLSPRELADEYHRMDLAAFQTTGTQVYESRVQAADGARRHVVFHKATFPDPAGGVGGLVGIITDITGLKQAEAELRQSEQRFRDITENAAEWVWEVDSQGKYTYSSPVVEQLLGYKPDEILGKYFYDSFLPNEREELKNASLAAFAAKQPFRDFLNPNLHKDGRTVWLSTSGIPILDEQGNLLGYRGADIDITARKQAEAELRESERRFRLMAETIQDVFWIATPEIVQTLYVSPAYEQVWGRPRKELYRDPKVFIDAIHPEDRERVRSEIAAAQAQSIPWSHEYRIIKPDGAERWIQDRGFPVRDDQGRVILFTGVATDVTEHKALEQQLFQAQKMEAVGRLAGGVAHDFNNLLMAIKGYGELMRANVHKGDPLYDHLENILKASDRAAALTQQLLTFSRRQIVHPQVIDLNRVVLDLEPMLRRLIGEDLDLEVVTDRSPGVVKADPGQLGQIIMNLVVNARDAMPKGGRLTLKTTPVEFKKSRHTRFGLAPPGAYVMLRVQDTGVGMDEATQAHIFEPFFTTKEPGKGTGLGLSTVYGIVRQSGGYLDLASEPGAGSTFTIYLPRLDAVVEPPKAKIPITASFRGEETILLVEDEDVLRGLLAKFLRLYGYAVLEARHGGEALLLCERHQGPIHVMVTDVVMPQMSGRELADRLTPLRPEMKVLYMSGYTEDALVQHGVADLSVAFLQKPFKPIDLARLVYAVLHPPVSQ